MSIAQTVAEPISGRICPQSIMSQLQRGLTCIDFVLVLARDDAHTKRQSIVTSYLVQVHGSSHLTLSGLHHSAQAVTAHAPDENQNASKFDGPAVPEYGVGCAESTICQSSPGRFSQALLLPQPCNCAASRHTARSFLEGTAELVHCGSLTCRAHSLPSLSILSLGLADQQPDICQHCSPAE